MANFAYMYFYDYFPSDNVPEKKSDANSDSDISTQLEKGIKIEKEHTATIEKIYNHEVTIDEAPKLIASDHLKEMPDYYTKLEKMEASANNNEKYADGGYFRSVGLEGYLVGKSRNPYIGKEREIECKDPNIRCFSSEFDYRFIYVLDDKNIAVLHIDEENGNYIIRNAFTKEDYRRKGYGKKLYKEAIKRFPKLRFSQNLSPDGKEFKKHIDAYAEGGDIINAIKMGVESLAPQPKEKKDNSQSKQ